jgi:methylase of polypeptide subunit release factors
MKNNLIVEMSHQILNLLIKPDAVILDMTMGNGHDTLFLASKSSFVYAFDIQDQALEQTKSLLKEHQINHVVLIKDNHLHFDQYVNEMDGAIFNLGYLPGGDKSIHTQTKTTLDTLIKLLTYLKKDGFIQLVVYPGHREGLIEFREIHAFLSELDQSNYKVLRTDLPFQKNLPPMIWTILKK